MKIEKRTDPLRIVRNQGKVPGVLFGKSIDPVSIQVDEKELHDALKEHGKTQTFKVKLGRETHQVYIKDVQRAILKRSHLLNVELLRVEKNDMITAKIPLHVIGREDVEHHGRIIQVVSDAVEVEYGVGKGQSHIEVDVSQMALGDTIQVKDLHLPEDIHVLDDPDKVLIHFGESRVHEIEIQPEPENEVAEAEDEAASKTTE